MIAVFVAITYQTNELEANFRVLERMKYLEVTVEFIEVDIGGKTY